MGWGVISSCQSVHTDCRLGFFSSSSFWRIVKQQHRETSGFIKYWMGSKLFEFFWDETPINEILGIHQRKQVEEEMFKMKKNDIQ